MGLLVEGEWHDQWYDTKSTGGKYVRKPSQFRNWVTADGRTGSSGVGGFEAQADRYHLYVSYACPWAQRTLIIRELKGLQDKISVSVVHPFMGSEGWTFDSTYPGTTGDPINDADRLFEIYLLANSAYTGRVTVPVLWDKMRGTIVSNESSEIIRMFNSGFDAVGTKPGDHYPEHLKGAVVQIKKLGGGRIEGYPEDAEGRKASPAFLFNGSLSTFERHGFKRSRLIGKLKWVVTRTVR